MKKNNGFPAVPEHRLFGGLSREREGVPSTDRLGDSQGGENVLSPLSASKSLPFAQHSYSGSCFRASAREHLNGFALLEVLLAVILIAIVTVGSFALVKNFRSTSAMQQLTRYSTTIAENYMPFLDGSASNKVMDGDKLSREFLQSIHIPSNDLMPTNCDYCYVNSGLYIEGGTSEIQMKFGVRSYTSTDSNFLLITLEGVSLELKDQLLQSLGPVFSLYCPNDRCRLGESFNGTVNMLFPKADETMPDEKK